MARSHIHFDDLCQSCGTDSQRLMQGMYIISKGKTGVLVETEKVVDFIKYKSSNELCNLVNEVTNHYGR